MDFYFDYKIHYQGARLKNKNYQVHGPVSFSGDYQSSFTLYRFQSSLA